MILEEFINFIEGIGFKLDVNPLDDCVEGNTHNFFLRKVHFSASTLTCSCFTSFDFSYNGYNIYLTKTRYSLDHNIIGVIDSPSRTNQRNFDLSDLELLEIHFKSEIRSMKLKELGI